MNKLKIIWYILAAIGAITVLLLAYTLIQIPFAYKDGVQCDTFCRAANFTSGKVGLFVGDCTCYQDENFRDRKLTLDGNSYIISDSSITINKYDEDWKEYRVKKIVRDIDYD